MDGDGSQIPLTSAGKPKTIAAVPGNGETGIGRSAYSIVMCKYEIWEKMERGNEVYCGEIVEPQY